MTDEIKRYNKKKENHRFSFFLACRERLDTLSEVEKGRQIFRFFAFVGVQRYDRVQKRKKVRKHKAFSMIALCLFVLLFALIYSFIHLIPCGLTAFSTV